jgi:DNA primase
MSDQDDTVYIVEGFKACLWMIQAGFKNTVAAMGSYLSERQQRLIHRLGGNVVLCFDNDEAGRRATQQVGNLLWRPMYGRVKVLRYPAHHNKTQPDDYPLEQLREMVLSSTQFVTQGPLRRQQYIS